MTAGGAGAAAMGAAAMAPWRRPRRWAFGALTIVLALGTVEAVFRAVFALRARSLERYVFPREEDVNFERHPFLPWIYRPSRECLMVLRNKFTGEPVEIAHHVNSWGFRGPETTLEKPAGRLRVLCLGGSTTQGCGPEETTWPRRLEARLAAALGRDVEALNFGVPLFDSTASAVHLAVLGVSFAPDLVIVSHGYNDLFFQKSPRKRPDGAGFYLGYRRPFGTQDLIPTAVLERWHSLAYATFKLDEVAFGRRRNMIRLVLDTRDAAPGAYDPAVFERNLRSMAALARGCGARTLFTTLHHFDPGHEDARLLARSNDVVRRLGAELGVPVADLDARLPLGDASLAIDDIHLTPKGDDLVAAAVAEKVLEAGLLGPARAEAAR